VKKSDNIRAYVKNQSESKIKKVKVESVVTSTLSELVSLITDADNHKNWVFMNDHASILDTLSCFEWKYYGYSYLPWPVADRDFITSSKMTQDSVDYSIVIEAKGQPDLIPENEGVVRVRSVSSQWSLNPLGNGEVHITFELAIDIGGKIPAWLINLGVTRGPLNTMEGLIDQLEQGNYKNSNRPNIKEL